jgi:hypothetical protein|tara:strand:- start:1876 stop:2544 length:669 start_codon:yes stop_codon:yes gene_type:complete
MELINILELEDRIQHIENLKQICQWIEKNERHRNAKNYYNLDQIVENFDSFEIIYDDKNIVAFSGLWNNGNYPQNIARCCTRTYYHPDYRNSGITRWGDDAREGKWSEDWFIPYEEAKARELGYEYAFISIELLVRRRSMQSLIKYLNKTSDWSMQEQMCNTCRQHSDKGNYIGINPDIACWQNVCYTSLVDNPNEFDLPRMTIDEYNLTYRNKQKERLKLD